MSTETQISANRLNAQKSTGPKTPEGKSKVSQNAVTHGLTALRPVLANEDPEEYALFRDDFFRHHAPVGILEETLAERAAETFWRLSRASTFETQVLNTLTKESQSDQEARNVSDGIVSDSNNLDFAQALINDFRNTHVLERLLGYELKIERTYFRIVKELRRIQSLRLNVAEASRFGSISENSTKEPKIERSEIPTSRRDKPKIPPFDPMKLLENIKTNPIELDPLTKIMMKTDRDRQFSKKAM
jgi:hypothetical protein